MGSSSKSLAGIKAISFDLDDTLFACAPVISLSNQSLAQFIEFNYPALAQELRLVSLDEYSTRVFMSHPDKHYDVSFIREQALLLAADAALLPNPEHVAATCFQHFVHQRSVNCSSHLFEGAVDTLRRLKERGFRIATISNGNANIRLIEELSPLIEVHVSAIHARNAKPHPAPFVLLASLLSLSPSEILHVGDDYKADVLGAIEAGYAGTVWVTSALPVPADHRADFVLPSIANLDTLIPL